MNGRRAGQALGAGVLASLPFAVLVLIAGWPPGNGSFQAFAPLMVLTTIASALSMGLLVLGWDRTRWQPRGRAAWSGLFLAASVLGAALTGFFVGLGSAVFSLVSDLGSVRWSDGSLPMLPLQGLAFGVLIGFPTLSAPLGGLLFVLLARQRQVGSPA